MAFGNIATLYYPTSANAGASQWGINVRKLLSAADAGSDTTTITNHGTGAAVTVTHSPFATTSADLVQGDYGFAVTPSDMTNPSGGRRFMAAGTHTLTATVRNNTSAVAKSGCRLDVFLYRIAATTRVRTLIDSWSSASFSTGNVMAFVTVTASKSLASIVLEIDETLQYSTELNAPGSAATGETYTLGLGTNGGVATRIDHPTLGVFYQQSSDVIGIGTVALAGEKVSLTAAVTGVGTVTQAEYVQAKVGADVVGIGTVAQALKITPPAFALTGIGTIDTRAKIAIGDIPSGSSTIVIKRPVIDG